MWLGDLVPQVDAAPTTSGDEVGASKRKRSLSPGASVADTPKAKGGSKGKAKQVPIVFLSTAEFQGPTGQKVGPPTKKVKSRGMYNTS